MFPEGEEREKGPEKLFEEMIAKKIPQHWKGNKSSMSRYHRESQAGKTQEGTHQDT